jgi:hypothetical protein
MDLETAVALINISDRGLGHELSYMFVLADKIVSSTERRFLIMGQLREDR